MSAAKVVLLATGDSETSALLARHFKFEVINVKNLSQDGLNGKGFGVPADLIRKTITESNSKHFLIDGFPPKIENLVVFEKKVGIAPEFVILRDATFENQRLDDPFFQSYEARGLIRRVNVALPADQLLEILKPIFASFVQDELLDLSKQLLDSIDQANFKKYEELCDENLTAFEAESQGQLVEGLPFHEYYFKMGQSGKYISRVSTIAAPKVVLLSEDVALLTYTRLMQGAGTPLAGNVDAYNETRIWKRIRTSPEDWKWKHVHFHRSNAPTTPLTYDPRLH